MKNKINKLGFTLIELLVVITIIGILATGTTTVYTSQIQKARDSNRITDIKSLQGAFEQAYSDASLYPYKVAGDNNCDYNSNTSFGINCLKTLGYLTLISEDKKKGKKGAEDEILNYLYNVGNLNGVENQIFEVSTAFEATASIKSRANDSRDGGNYNLRFEAGNGKETLNTKQQTNTNTTSCANADTNAGIIIAGDC